MYSKEQRRVAIETFIRFDHSYADTIAELGYPDRHSLRNWWREYRETGEVPVPKHEREPKYTLEMRREAVEHYLSHGRRLARTMRALGLRHELGVRAALRTGRAGRRPRSKLPPRGGGPWLDGRGISARPPEASDRAVPGHWEGDLVVGGDMSSCLVTLVERRSRFLLMARLLAHDAATVERKLEEMAASIPNELRRTLTWDQGSEMARVADFELATPFRVYFCDPHSPWERPSNENTNGLVREFFPKGTRFSEVTDEEVARAQWLLNNRPRKVLNWKMPAEVMQEVLAKGAMTA